MKEPLNCLQIPPKSVGSSNKGPSSVLVIFGDVYTITIMYKVKKTEFRGKKVCSSQDL